VETLCQAGESVAELIAVPATNGEYPVHDEGIAEVVADRGYHSNAVMVELAQAGLRSYIAEPDRGPRNWDGRSAERDAVYANRRRIKGERGKRLQSQRGEKIERNFAHQFDTGGMDRLYLRGKENVHKRLLVQAAACNLALLLRSWYGAGKPKAAHDLKKVAIFVFLRLIRALFETEWADTTLRPLATPGFSDHEVGNRRFCCSPKRVV
jgi:hypothetical protein